MKTKKQLIIDAQMILDLAEDILDSVTKEDWSQAAGSADECTYKCNQLLGSLPEDDD